MTIRESIFFALACILGAGYLGSDDTEHKVVAEKQRQACERATENAERFAFHLAHVLNGGNLKTDETLVSCRQIQRSS